MLFARLPRSLRTLPSTSCARPSSSSPSLAVLLPSSRASVTSRLLSSTASTMTVQRVKVASASDVPRAGAMKDFVFAGEGDNAVKVLLANVNGKLSAMSAKCTHYGAPLANGVMTGAGKIICPWHGACFDAKTGDIEDAPALDNLLTFKVETDDNGDVFVEADADKLQGKPGVPTSCASSTASSADQHGIVIIGGGSAAINAVESARKSGYTGNIAIYTKEKHAPIDRTKLSKALIASEDAVTWRSPSHLKNVLKTNLTHGTSAVKVDVKGKTVTFDDGSSVPYDSLILATGGTPRRLPLPGAKEGELEGVMVLRSISDTKAIVGACGDKQDKDVVVVGTSFIGMETAIALAGQKKAKSVTVVGMEEVPFQNVLGKEVGQGLAKTQEKNNGLKFYNKAGVVKIEGKDGKASALHIKDENGKEVALPADVVVLGVGVAPATEYLKESSGFPELLKDGSIAVDKDLRVIGLPQDAGVFACGDIATVPARDEAGATVRIEHWNVAGNHGRAVGKTIAAGGKSTTPYDVLPIFWSALGSQLRYVSDGNPPGFDETYVDGNPEELKFAAYYAKKGKITAVCTMGVDPLMVHSASLMSTGRMPSLADIKSGKNPLEIPLSTSNL